MKQVFNYRNGALALFTVLTTVMAAVTQAAEDPKPNAIELTYIGIFKDKPVFDLNFTSNGADQDYVLKIRDKFDNTIYTEVIKKGTLTRRFILRTAEVEDDGLNVSFQISSNKNNKTIVYQINRNTQIVEDVLINKVD